MPTNLPPEYYEVEKRYKAAESPEEKAAALEELLSTIPKHKGTDHLRADLRLGLLQLQLHWALRGALLHRHQHDLGGPGDRRHQALRL